MKVSLLPWVFSLTGWVMLAGCVAVAGCGDAGEASSEAIAAHTNDTPEVGELQITHLGAAAAVRSSGELAKDASIAGAKPASVEALPPPTKPVCADPCSEQTPCGQICITLKGAGSSCHLIPTANDLGRPPRSVLFDCNPIERGPNGYDYDTLGHVSLMGDTCEALQKDGPHRVALLLGCPPGE